MAAKLDKKIATPKRVYVRARDRDYLMSNLAMLLKSGVPVGEALHSLEETSSRKLRRVLVRMQVDVDEGKSLWKVLDASGLLSMQALALVRLGEESGNLTENLLMAAQQEEKQRAFRSKVYSALLYPVFVLSITCVVGLGIAWFLLPRLAATFSQLNLPLPLISRIFIGIGTFLQANGIWAVPAMLVVLALLIYVLFVAPKTRVIGRRILFHVPGIGNLLREVEVARFGYLLGTLLDAGLPITEALQLLTEATEAPQFRIMYSNLKRAFEDGYSFQASLPKYSPGDKLLPSSIRQMIIAAEGSGALPETLQGIGVVYENKIDISTQNLESVLEPMLLLIVWAGVLGVAVAVILPVYSLVNGLGG